jgi:predicted dehydrogenase
VVGTSWWVERMYLPAFLSDPRADVVAFCGRDPARAAALADRVAAAGRPRPATEGRWEALLERGDLDAVVVAVPDDLHRPVAEAALGAGLHVCCEKPLARSAADARAVRDAAARAGRLGMTYFTYRWLPHYRLARALVRGDAALGIAPRLGRVRQLHVRFLSALGRASTGGTFMPPPRDPWRDDPARSGGVLTDLGSHLADLVRHVAGDVTRVAASVRADGAGALSGRTSDAVAMALEGRGPSGDPWHGTAHLCTAVDVGDRGLLQSLLVVGDAATLDLEVTVQGAVVRIYANGRAEQVDIPDAYGAGAEHPFAVFTALPVGARLFVEAVAAARAGDGAGARALVARAEWAGFDDGLAAQELVDAARRSADGGGWEAVGDRG